MGRLIDMLKQKCENCKRIALPRSISGKYLSGEFVVLHECSFCGYLRFHGQLGFKGVRKRKQSPVSKKGTGRFSNYLRKVAK
tara:strand:- start:3686 stop:3931 length:246 start_codon:yes stop_codon:yes gene_type:complete